MLREFEHYGAGAFETDVVSLTPAKERVRLLSDIGIESEAGASRQIDADYTLPEELKRLDPGSYDSIVQVASQRMADGGESDAQAVMAI